MLSLNLSAHRQIEIRIAEASHLITQSPKNSNLYLQRGELYREHNQFILAEGDYQKAYELGVDKYTMLFYKALLWRERNNLTRAIKLFQQVVENSTKNTIKLMAYVNLAEILQAEKKWLIAAKYYQKAIDSGKKHSSILYLATAQAYKKAGKGYFDNAIEVLKLAISYNKGVISLYNLAIEIETQRNNLKQVDWWKNKLLKIYPNYEKDN